MNMLYRAITIGVVTGVAWGGVATVDAQEATKDAPFDCSRVGTLIEDATREELRDAKLHFRSTKLYFSQELFEKSARSAELATHLDPTQARYFMRLGMAYGRLGCYEAAGQAFRTGAEIAAADEKQMKDVGGDIENNQKFFHNERFQAGIDLLNEGQEDAALTEFYNAIAIDPTSVLAWRNIGVVKSGMDGLAPKLEALEAFEKAIEYEPDNVSTQSSYRQVLALAAVENYNAALESLEVSTDAEPAARTSELEKMRKSLEMLKEAIEQGAEGEQLMELHQHSARILQAIGQYAEDDAAKSEAYETAIEHHRDAAMRRVSDGVSVNDDPTYLQEILGCFAMLGANDSLLVYGGKLIDLDPQGSDGYMYKAHALREAQNNKEALTYLLMEQCLAEGESLKGAAAINSHIPKLITSYKPSDDIVKASILNLENPDEIRIKKGTDIFEVWIWWTKGTAETYYNGASAGTITFKPVTGE